MSSDKQKLDNIDDVLSTGISSVKHEDQQINYRSVNELKQIRSMLSRKVAKKKRKQPFYSSGLK